MLKVSLKLTIGEVNVLYLYSQQAFLAWSDPINRPYMINQAIQLAEHYERIRRQLYSWSMRPTNKEYQYTLPVSLAWAYHLWLNKSIIQSLDRSTLVAKLDKALVNCHIKPQIYEPNS